VTTDLPAMTPPTRPGHITLRYGFMAYRINLRALGYAAVAFLALVVLVIWSSTLGSYDLSFTDVVRAAFGGGSEDTEMVVRTLRLPRIFVAVLVGAALAVSGTIFQGLARNPLVSPDIIGINSGASLAAIAVMILGIGGVGFVPVAAFLGAVVTAAAIYALSWKNGVNMNRLILVGIGVGSILSAGTTYMTVKYPLEITRPAIVWSMGSIYASKWRDVAVLGIALALLIPVAIILMEQMRMLQFGDTVTKSLGVPLERTRLLLIVIGCAFAAVAVAIAGPVGFVALIVPHMARMLLGLPTGSVLVFTALLGSIMLLVSDIVGQHALPVVLPVGVVTGAVGAPYFLYLLYRSNTRT
jgi:iron complex transport system permease protein